MGMAHGFLNLSATFLYAISLFLRPRKKFRPAGIRFALLGYAVSSLAAYVGGHLVFGEKIGVNHAAQDLPKEFVPVLAEAELHEGEMKSADANGTPVLLVKRGGEIFALTNICSHLGGPLAEGTLDGDVVQCPWHGSRFSICDGSVVDGPATFPQPGFEARIQNGQIEVRAARG
jgi:nitrite reductase/ring-hydroxylating ferredoxin subunit